MKIAVVNMAKRHKIGTGLMPDLTVGRYRYNMQCFLGQDNVCLNPYLKI